MFLWFSRPVSPYTLMTAMYGTNVEWLDIDFQFDIKLKLLWNVLTF